MRGTSDPEGPLGRVAVLGKWVLIAGLLAFALQLAWCLHENLSDERYFARNFISTEADRLLAGATIRDGTIQGMSVSALDPYRGTHGSAYGFRIIDADNAVLAESNGALIEAERPLALRRSRPPDAWQQKLGPQWFELIGGVRRQVDGHEVWVEVLTHGDPENLRLRALVAEIFTDVWIPLAPTIVLILVFAMLAVPRDLRRQFRLLRNLRASSRGFDSRDPLPAGALPRGGPDPLGLEGQSMTRVASLLQAQRHFVMRVSQDLKSQLAVLLLELNRISDEPARRLEGDVGRISHTVNRLLWATSGAPPSDGAAHLPGRVDLVEVANEALAEMRSLALLRSCELTLSAERPETFTGYQDAVAESIRSVVENTIKRAPGRNTLQVTCGPGCCVTIEDAAAPFEGCEWQRTLSGLPANESAELHAALGLSPAKVAVEIHRGTIELSRSPLGGLRVVMRYSSITPETDLGRR